MTLLSKIAPILALAADAGEDAAVAAIEKLKLEAKTASTLHTAEVEAHGATRARLAELEQADGLRAKAEHERGVSELTADIERRNGKGEQSKELVEVMQELAAVSLEKARAFVAKIPKRLPIGEPSLSHGNEPGAREQGNRLTAQELAICKQLRITPEQYRKSNPVEEV